MGVNTDGEETGPGSTVTDGVEQTETACEFEQQHENETSLPQDVDGDVGLQDQKPTKGTGKPLIPSLQSMPSQHTSVVPDTEQNAAHIEYTDGGSSVPSNTPTSLRPDTALEDRRPELSHGASVFHVTNISADIKAELKEVSETLDAMKNRLRVKISPSDANAKLELPFNPDIDEMDEVGYTPLFEAALEGHLEEVDDLILRGANPNKPSKGGLRPLHAAAQEGHAHIVDFLILQGADVDVECEMGLTPLHITSSSGYTCIVDILIEAGANVNKEDNNGWTPFNAVVQKGHLEALKYIMTKGAKQNRYDGMTPLYAAAQFGHSDIVKLFIDNGADVNEEDDEERIPLHGAAIEGNTEVMAYLIQHGSDVNKKENTGWTPFNAAIEYGHLEAVKFLITEGAKQNTYIGMSPLYAAALYGHLDIVKFFISNGADVNEEDDKGRITLHGAAFRGRIEVMEYLIQQGSEVNKEDNTGWTAFNAAVKEGHLEAVKCLLTEGTKQNRYDGMTPLFAAAESCNLDVVKYFISNGADVNAEDDIGMIPLHGAAGRGHKIVMEYLIQQGSEVNKEDNTGWTPFNAAIQNGHLEAVKYLITEGAKQNRYNGMTPPFAAARFGHLDIVKFFFSKRAVVNEENDTGRIPLHAAAARGHLEVMEYLIQQGSDVNKEDNAGWTPFNAAVEHGNLEAVKYLINRGAKQNRYASMTPLYAAARLGHIDIVKFLIFKGADVNEENDKWMIPLHAAAARGHLEIMEYLIQHGSDVNKGNVRGWTPFNAAVENGYLGAVKHLVIKGAKQNRYNGMTPLYTAAQLGHLDIIKFFISKGADVNEENVKRRISLSPLHAACYNGSMDVVKFLLRHNANVNEQDNDGWTPLEAAAQEGHQDKVDYLTLNEASMNLKVIDGLMPLQAAAYTGHPHVTEGISSRRDDPGVEEIGDPRPGGHQNLITRGYITAIIKDADTQSRTVKLTSQVDFAEEMNYCNQADNAKREADKLSLKNLSTGTNDVETDIGRPNVNEHPNPRRGDPNEEETGDPLSRDHNYGAENLATRGYENKKVIQMEGVDTQSRIGQLASQVDNVEDGNDGKQANNVKRGTDELSLKDLPTRTNGVEKGGNEEHNPFIHAKLKYPEKREQDPIPDQIEEMKSPVTRNYADGSSLHGSQTWQYSGFDTPFLQTIGNDGHPSEDPESRRQSLIDENREMSESSSPMNVGDDLPINESSEIESSPTQPPTVVHQKLYDGNPVASHGTTSNPVWKIRALGQTFLQMIVALAIILAGSPVLVAGIGIAERVTLQAGKPGVVPFHFQRSPSDTSQDVPFYTLRFESNPRPFSVNGKEDIVGFKNPSQIRRFSTSVTDLDTSPCVNLMIDEVDTLDEDGYVLTTVWHSFDRYETVKKEIVVQIPPGRAKCFITFSENVDYPYEVHCRATTGSVETTILCYQDDQRLDVTGDITDNGLITSGIFFLLDYTHFSCCSHDVTMHVNETTCNDFEWPPIKETTRQVVNTVPTSVTTPSPQIESHTGSGACRQFMLPSLWHFTYLFINLLAFVAIY